MAFVPTLDLHEHTLPGLLRRNAERLPDNDCIVAPEFGVCWSWKEFDRRTSEVARGMYAMGIRKGDHVAIWSTNTPEWMLTMFASAKLGAILVTVNTNYKQFELNYLLNQSDTKMLVMTAGVKNNDYISHITGLVPALTTEQPDNISCKQLPFLKRVLLIGDSERRPMGMSRFDDLYEAAKSVPESVVEESIAGLDTHETINMQYTSGTTGFPKGVMLTHYNITNNGQFLGDCMKLTEEDRLLIVVPLFHCFGCVLGVMACLTHRCTMLIVEDFNAELVLQALHKEKATAVYGVPTMFIGMLEHPEFDRFDFSRLRTGIMAGSPCPPETMREVMERMNMRDVTICYGLTETSPVFTQTSVDDDIPHKCETVGRAHPPVEVRVLDVNDGHICGPGEHGELCCKGYNVMKGYYKMPEETAKAIDANGFLHSGDMGTVDEDGYFRVTGRIKDMIIRGGENIYPLEVENFLLTMPGVLDAQVVGIPDARLGEIVGAFIRTRPGYEAMTEDDVRAYAIPRIARYKVPKRVFFVDDFPMTPSMKVQKFKLREMAEELVRVLAQYNERKEEKEEQLADSVLANTIP